MRERILIAASLIALCPACSNMEPVEATPEQVQHMIVAENILPPGEAVRVVTSDGKIHKFRVTEVDAENGLIRGEKTELDIDDVVAVETKEFSMGKTALLAGGTYLALALLAIAIGPVLLL
jgi:predicted membrane GTPase involved in stress response